MQMKRWKIVGISSDPGEIGLWLPFSFKRGCTVQALSDIGKE
jgi:hypothetical protein